MESNSNVLRQRLSWEDFMGLKTGKEGLRHVALSGKRREATRETGTKALVVSRLASLEMI